MKKYISSIGLFARSTLRRVLIVLLISAVLQLLMWGLEFRSSMRAYNEARLDMPTVEKLVDRGAANAMFRLTLTVITVILCLPGASRRSHTEYTLGRLSVSERGIFFCQAAYNAAVYLLLFAAQTVLLFAMVLIYRNLAPAESVAPNIAYIAFYRNRFMHSVLPLEDVRLWIRNIALVLILALSAAEFPYLRRRGRMSATPIAVLGCVWVFFSSEIGSVGQLVAAISGLLVVCGIVACGLTLDKRRVEDEREGDV